MSAIEDLRKVIQDLVAPDLKAIAERQTASDAIATARHNELLAKLETFNAIHTARYDAIMYALNVDKRLDAVERGQAKQSPGTRIRKESTATHAL